MADPSDTRRAAIVEASTGVFLRYGFKKTSMDDLARAAGLSRQGLYLHFSTKEALFKEAVIHVVEKMRASARAALEREDLGIEERLLAAFEAKHGPAVGHPGAEHMNELLATAAELVGPVVGELEEHVVTDVARALRAAGIAARWKEAGVSGKELGEHLVAVSAGAKQKASTLTEYRERMRVAVRIVCRGGGGAEK